MIDPKSLVGQVLDRRYRLVRFLGRGAFGWVYAAEELVGETVIGSCAVKLIRPQGPEHRERILREFSSAARLSHPRLVPFRGASEVPEGLLAGTLCLAMGLCEHTLKDRLEGGRRLDVAEALVLCRDLAEVMAWLHGQGAVHRDVKPDNVFGVDGRWKLGDLGLVKAVEGSRMQASGLWGTPLYLAPEAMDNLVGPSVDLWALGVLLQECLAGVFPYQATSEGALLAALQNQEPSIAPGLPAPLDAVVRGCLVKDPRARWTAAQVLEVLAGASQQQGTRPVAPPLPPAPSPAPRPASPRVQVASPRPPRPSPVSAGPVALGRNAQGRERFQVEGGGPVLVSLPAGRFVMGSPAGAGSVLVKRVALTTRPNTR